MEPLGIFTLIFQIILYHLLLEKKGNEACSYRVAIFLLLFLSKILGCGAVQLETAAQPSSAIGWLRELSSHGARLRRPFQQQRSKPNFLLPNFIFRPLSDMIHLSVTS